MTRLFLCLGIAIFLTVGCGPGDMASKTHVDWDGWEGY